jgi:hypothetical protein
MKESLIRTVVPILYALLVRHGVVEWLGVDDVLVQSALTAVVTALIYMAIRVAERIGSSRWGWLLGYPSAPTYTKAGV